MLNVAELLAQPASRERVSLKAVIERHGTADAYVEGQTQFDITIEAIDSQSVQVKGTVTAPSTLVCRRCLATANEPLTVEVDEIFRPSSDVWEEGYEVIDSTHIDLELLVRDAMTLALPTFPVCSPDCKGLCANCGADLNVDECTCDSRPVDIRWAALDELIDPSN